MRVQMVRLTVISIFAGCGGSSLGYQMAGFRELLAIDFDRNAVETFKLNFPEVPIWQQDIKEISGQEILKFCKIKKGELDILDGSPPCQGFSTAGRRKFNDPRNSLFMEFARLLDELQPRVFVMENVAGMVKGAMKQAYLEIIKTLRKCGYRARGEIMNAMWFNVPQSRERVIIIGVRKDLEIEPSHPKPQGKPMTAQNAIGEMENNWSENKPEFQDLKQGKSLYRYSSGTIRIYANRPIPTIKGPGAGGTKGGNVNIHYFKNRYLRLNELKVLSTFPIAFKMAGKPREKIDRIGNSVPPNLMKAIAGHVRINVLEKIDGQG